MSSIIVAGDVHRDFGTFNAMLSSRRPDIVLQCGDFGYWPREPLSEVYGRMHPDYPKDRPAPKVPEGTNVFWCDGNHEDHQELGFRTTDELWPGVWYMSRGSLLDLPDGRRVMFFGGATSVDAHLRVEGVSWFPEERIHYADITRMDYVGPVDIVISHTCPKEFPINGRDTKSGYYNDCSRLALSHILTKYQPSLWYFGHWHKYMTGYTMGCRWTCLNYFGQSNCWEELKT
jgi:hypothetical protein